MPSFDVVSKADLQEIDNAVNNVKKEIETRYDFKGTEASIEHKASEITVIADNDHKLKAIQDMLKTAATRRKIEVSALEFKPEEKASGNTLRQKIVVKQGVDKDTAKEIVKYIKDSKMKVQASIRGEEVRVEGKKRDDLQEAIALLRTKDFGLPLQYINFRD